jgi:hypothetical protein
MVHAHPQSLKDSGKVPRIYKLTVDSGLAAHRLEPGSVEKGRQQRVAIEGLVQSRNRSRCAFQGAGELRIDVVPGRAGSLWWLIDQSPSQSSGPGVWLKAPSD